MSGNISIDEILESCKAFANQGGKHKYFAVWLTKNNFKNFHRFDTDFSGEVDYQELSLAAQQFLNESEPKKAKPDPTPPASRRPSEKVSLKTRLAASVANVTI